MVLAMKEVLVATVLPKQICLAEWYIDVLAKLTDGRSFWNTVQVTFSLGEKKTYMYAYV